ncbi:MAG TPA: hypothetical protein VFG89_07995 [Coriobacteriia bacterium]|nr:hypothetical protein [Coriobacteriia bacterium]
MWLIVIGSVILAAQFIPGVAWWNAWPLIIVVAGVIHAFTPGDEGWGVHRLFDGLVTVSWGLVFLAITTGYVGFGVMWSILRLWPVLLIAIGFDLLGKALRLSWVRVLGSLAIIAALAFAVTTTSGYVPSVTTRTTSSQVLTEPVDGVQTANLAVSAGAGPISVSKGTDLVSVSGSAPWGEPTLTVDRSGSQASVSVQTPEPNGVVTGFEDAALDIGLSDSVLWEANVSSGVSQANLDLTGLAVKSVSYKTGVGECRLRLDAVPEGVDHATATVDAGVSSVTVLVPRGVAARVQSDSGLAGHSVQGDFEPQGNRTWETPSYAKASAQGAPVWDITIKTGIGAVTVDTY